MTQNPVQGGVKRRRTSQPKVSQLSGTSSVIKYSALGSLVTSDTSGDAIYARTYAPGFGGGLNNTVGPTIVSYYSTAKFTSSTKTRWEPSVSFNTSGRVYVGFTDNPEAIASLYSLAGSSVTSYIQAVKGLGDVISFPVWQETDVSVPSRLRRKMFDVNGTVVNTDVNVLDRSAQTAMFVAVDGMPASTRAGTFWFHDDVVVEGIVPIVT